VAECHARDAYGGLGGRHRGRALGIGEYGVSRPGHPRNKLLTRQRFQGAQGASQGGGRGGRGWFDG
jgi:hypothetical protein